MAYTIVASVCQHAIRTSSHLPWSGSTLDFSVHYCNDCLRSRSVRSERREAEREHERARFRHDAHRMNYSDYRSTRQRHDRARLAEVNDNDYWTDRDDRERRATGRMTLQEESRRFAGTDDPEWRSFRREMQGNRDFRFETPSSHRRESQYRDQPSYRRSSRSYSPGRHADTTGHGYYDTSGFEGRSRRQSRSTRPSSRPESRQWRGDRDSNDYQAYLSTLSDDEIDSRRRDVESTLRRYYR
jgi:hypothetical protein